jgi:hypothetical protein
LDAVAERDSAIAAFKLRIFVKSKIQKRQGITASIPAAFCLPKDLCP